MTIPDFQSVMRPALDILSDDKVRTLGELRDLVAERMGVTAEEREVLLPSGTQRTFDNRVGWAMSHLAAVGAVSRASRGNYQITARGHQLLDENRERIDLGVLDQFPELREFRGGGRRVRREAAITTLDEAATPTERIEVAVEELHDAVSAELLDRVRSMDPTDFERLVIRLMQAMGYGGASSDAARHLGRTGDNGVDGVIDEDRLGLDQVYIQAKRWAADHAVRRPDIQGFVGAGAQRATDAARPHHRRRGQRKDEQRSGAGEKRISLLAEFLPRGDVRFRRCPRRPLRSPPCRAALRRSNRPRSRRALLRGCRAVLH